MDVSEAPGLVEHLETEGRVLDVVWSKIGARRPEMSHK